MNAKQKAAVKMVERILSKRRSNNIISEQKAYENFVKFCDENNYSFEETFSACVTMIKKMNPVSSSINYGSF